ncbi:nuclease-related domain-containing protein [Propionicimonas paludicola]|uniref:nuclease-related domain-containing protein n=1 Tax=Propionicimonas paludicola TaxID=185243 RepID=UPI00147631F3|nr:nuclease-related domain-containing protein [Propionicimonas paludicola]
MTNTAHPWADPQGRPGDSLLVGDWPPPDGEPTVADLAFSAPGSRLQTVIAAQAAAVPTGRGRRRAHRRSSWEVGVEGERLVAAELARLTTVDPRWHVLHSLPVGRQGADIDHLVIGPCGIFTINAKHHPRGRIWVAGATFMVNGNRVP